jgi:HTH-type transcriptional regulator/antitoxin HipB
VKHKPSKSFAGESKPIPDTLLRIVSSYTKNRIEKLHTVSRVLTIYALSRMEMRMDQLARTPKQIGSIVQRARTQRNWTQADLAQRAGLRQATISNIETGEKDPRMDSVLRVLGALDLELRIGTRLQGSAKDIEDLF